MSYTEQDYRKAQRVLREIYNKKTPKQRIELAEKFGYGGVDSSKTRALRRITAQVLPPQRVVSLNQYYRSYTDNENRNPWKGTYPDVAGGKTAALETEFGDKQLYHITASVMAVARFPSGIVSFSQRFNTSGKIGETDSPAFSSDIRYLMEKFGEDAARQYTEIRLPESGELIFMAFSESGANKVVELAQKEGIDIAVPDAEGGQF